MSKESLPNRRQFFKLVGGTLASLGLGGLVEGCGPSAKELQEEALQKRGILGEHKLLNLASLREPYLEGEISGWAAGSFFHFIGGMGGGVSGEIESGTISSIQFAWETKTNKPEAIITELPITKVTFIREEGLETPRVEFQFNYLGMWDISENLSKGVKDFSNPNDYFTERYLETLEKAVIKISPEDFLKLPPGALGE